MKKSLGPWNSPLFIALMATAAFCCACSKTAAEKPVKPIDAYAACVRNIAPTARIYLYEGGNVSAVGLYYQIDGSTPTSPTYAHPNPKDLRDGALINGIEKIFDFTANRMQINYPSFGKTVSGPSYSAQEMNRDDRYTHELLKLCRQNYDQRVKEKAAKATLPDLRRH